MSGTMIERMARAICAASGDKWDAIDFTETGGGETPQEQRDGYLHKAKAALEAMREPTEAMLSEYWSDGQKRMCTEVYQVMIDAASEGKS